METIILVIALMPLAIVYLLWWRNVRRQIQEQAQEIHRLLR